MPGVASTCAVDTGGTVHCEQDQDVETAQIGLVYRFPLGRWVPYIHGLGGGLRMNGPVVNPLRWGWGGTVGGGVDYVLPFFHNHLAIRAIEFNDQLGHIDFGPLVLPAGISGGSDTINAIELSAGVVLRIGGKPKSPSRSPAPPRPASSIPAIRSRPSQRPAHPRPQKAHRVSLGNPRRARTRKRFRQRRHRYRSARPRRLQREGQRLAGQTRRAAGFLHHRLHSASLRSTDHRLRRAVPILSSLAHLSLSPPRPPARRTAH